MSDNFVAPESRTKNFRVICFFRVIDGTCIGACNTNRTVSDDMTFADTLLGRGILIGDHTPVKKQKKIKKNTKHE